VDALPPELLPLTATPNRSVLCLDFDGTLSPIVTDPQSARPLPEVPELLSRLAAVFGVVAVISGRPVEFLRQVLDDPAGVRLVGLYGLEWIGPDGIRVQAPGTEAWMAVIDDAVARATAEAPDGIYVEPKGLTVTLHWRHAPGSRPWVEAFTAREVELHHLAAHHSRQSIELGPPLSVDKGTVVHARAVGMEAVAAFGDDVGDLPAFRALTELAARGMSAVRVAVVDEESPSEVAAQADLVVQGAQGAVALLQVLRRAVE
jgi:trehalose 6-phosphate phosphatase